MKELILIKYLADGREVRVERQEYAIGKYRCLVYVAGRWVDGPAMPVPLPMPRNGLTHYLGGKAGGPLIGLTTAEVAIISQQLAPLAQVAAR